MSSVSKARYDLREDEFLREFVPLRSAAMLTF